MLDLAKLHDAVRHEGGVSRRLFMAYAASLSSTCVLGARARGGAPTPKFSGEPFTVGVASGDPAPRGVVLWTRLAPKPLEPFGGMAAENVEVAWEVADDESFGTIIQRGKTFATPQLAHSVHVEVDGLQPDRWYWYRFRAGDAESPIGRTRTMPRRNAMPEECRFGFASCQHYETGLYTAYEHMAKDNLDLVFHLGDYIYEGPGRDDQVRKHSGDHEIRSLEDYRIRHAQYKTDPLLQAMHAQCPWVVVWDDHEFDNNCACEISEEKDVDPVDFLVRRANAYQAYYEMMPLRRRSLPQGPHLQLYRKFAFGRLAEFFALDTRQYRTNQPNDDESSPLNEAAMSSKNSLLGAAQRDWLEQGLIASGGAWNVLAQQVMMALVDRAPGEVERYSMDQWPGAAHERNHLMRFMHERRVPNPIVLTGDIHNNWVNDLRLDDRQPDSPMVGTEFVVTSLSSGGNGVDKPDYLDALYAENPGVKYHNAQRGYVRTTVTPTKLTSDYCIVEDVTKPGAPLVVKASYAVESGRAGAQRA
jgi:alkaline phosphatase D